MTTLDHELETALRAETPRPSAAFTESLDKRVEQGFPRARERRLPGIPLARLAPPAAGLAALAAIVVAVSLSGGGSSHSGGSSGGGAASTSATSRESAPAQATSPKAAGGAGAGAGSIAGQRQIEPATPHPGGRHVERSAALTLGAPSRKLDSVANGIVSVVDRHHGFVLHSTMTTGGGGSSGGSFELRVPSGDLQGTLSDLSGLADVRSRTQASDDITAPYNSVSSQLDEARALRHGLLRRLSHATTDVEAQALRRRIHLASAQIRSLSARFARLQTRARLATIDVTLVRERAPHDSGGGGVGGAFHDGLHSLAVSFGIALRVLGVALPLGLLAALGWLGAGLLRRRRREAALF